MDEILKQKSEKLAEFLKAENIELVPFASLKPRDDGTFSIIAHVQLRLKGE